MTEKNALATIDAHRPQTTCGLPSRTSERSLPELARLLEAETSTGLDRLVSKSEAERFFNDLQGYEKPCSPDEATQAAENLIGLYPAREVHNATIFAKGITALMAAYPVYAVRRVCNPVTGLPSKLKFLPTLAEIKAALDDEKVRRGRMGKNCLAVLKAYREREEAEEYERNKGSHEERARKIAALLAPLKEGDAE
jgi:hypothetical protein